MTPARRALPLLPICLSAVPPALRTLLEQEGVVYREQDPGNPAGRFLLYDSRLQRNPPLAAGQQPVDVAMLAHGLSQDPFTALAEEQSAPCGWQVAGWWIEEEIARTDKRALRRHLMSKLRQRLEALGGIWLCLSAYPFPYQSAFNLRIDHDQYDADDFSLLLAGLAGREGECSHYVCAAGFERFPRALGRLRGHHVGSHGFHHHTYRGTEENLQNIARGIEFLSEHGLEPVGFVAPHGRFHRSLLAALEKLEVTHSSEFGLVYDELPLFPTDSRVLQLPVHPVCLGLFLEAAERTGRPATEAARCAAEYFSRLIAERYQLGEPVFLYGHPTGRLGRYPDVLRAILSSADNCGALWRTSLSRFAQWWRFRRRSQLQVFDEGDGRYAIHVDHPEGGFPLAVEYWRGRHVALMPLKDSRVCFNPGDLVYQSRRAGDTLAPVRVDRSHRLRDGLRRWLDWERVTPVDEISGNTVRGWMKRTLRKIKP